MHVPSTGELGAKYYYVEHSWSFAAEEAEKVADRTNGAKRKLCRSGKISAVYKHLEWSAETETLTIQKTGNGQSEAKKGLRPAGHL